MRRDSVRGFLFFFLPKKKILEALFFVRALDGVCVDAEFRFFSLRANLAPRSVDTFKYFLAPYLR